MKPDQHKKKRSAQYKKKHGIAKDSSKEKGNRRGDSKSCKAKEGLPNSTVMTDTTTSNGQTVEQNITISISEKDFMPSFSRRKVESNWDRYEGLPDDDEGETVTTRGVEFNRLLSETGHAEAQFRFQDEQSWEEEETQQSSEVGSQLGKKPKRLMTFFKTAGTKFLSVDVNALAQHIQAIPLPERLGISRCLFEDDMLQKLDRSAKDTSESTSLYSSESIDHYRTPAGLLDNTDNKSERKNTPSASSGNVRAHKSQIDGQRSCNSQTNIDNLKKDIRSSIQRVVSKEDSKSPEQRVANKDASSGLGERAAFKTDDGLENSKKTVNGGGCDDELDFLLSLENPVQVKGQGDKKKKEEDSGDVKEDDTTPSSKPSEEQDKSSKVVETVGHLSEEDATPAKTGTDDLEDWLNDMLDD